MQFTQMGSILQKRCAGITEKQWMSLLQQCEKNGLYLVIETNNSCLTKSPAGGFVPLPSKDDVFFLKTREELLEKGLSEGHHIYQKNETKKSTL